MGRQEWTTAAARIFTCIDTLETAYKTYLLSLSRFRKQLDQADPTQEYDQQCPISSEVISRGTLHLKARIADYTHELYLIEKEAKALQQYLNNLMEFIAEAKQETPKTQEVDNAAI